MWSMVIFVFYFYLPLSSRSLSLDVVFAVNAGGDFWIDSNDIDYHEDDNQMGFRSDEGRNLTILRVNYQDSVLYQSARYSNTTFGYEIPIQDDGNYVMILKFSENKYNESGVRVFDVLLNNQHVVASKLDIYDKVGFAVAHNEYIEFNVDRKKLNWGDEVSEVKSNMTRVDFIKGKHGNPYINAILIVKGRFKDVPQLLEEVEARLYRALILEWKKLPKYKRRSSFFFTPFFTFGFLFLILNLIPAIIIHYL